MVGLLKRYRELILVLLLLALPLGFFFAHAKRQHPSERSWIDRTVLTVVGPIERGVSWVMGGAIEGWRGYVALRHAHQRADELERQVNRLLLERAEAGQVRAENERLRRLLAFVAQSPERHVLGATVIGVRLDPKGLQLVTIDRGAADGVARLMAVAVGQGVVGRIYGVAEHSADVMLLSDRYSSIAVRVDRSRARANVRGVGSPYVAALEHALRSDDFVEGDVLVTSGTDGVFPRGLPVGVLTGVKRSGQGLYQSAEVKPAVDVTKLEEVLVLLDPPRVEDAPAATAAATPGAERTASAAGAKQP